MYYISSQYLIYKYSIREKQSTVCIYIMYLQPPSLPLSYPCLLASAVGEPLSSLKLDRVAPLIADPPNATLPLCSIGWSANTEIKVLTGTAYFPSLEKFQNLRTNQMV